MSTIDFDKLANEPQITSSYIVWTKDGYVGYNITTGTYGVSTIITDKYIAPLQGFIVEKGNTDGKLNFNPSIQATNPASTLRASANTGNKLDIIASNETASFLTTVANRESGDDSRKLFDGISNAPDVYTLKEETALGVNLIQTDDILIPVGLRTKYAGNITLTIKGMDSYDANITFIDRTENREINITGLSDYEYSFNYIPKEENDKAVAEENRFFVQIQPVPQAPTGLNTLPATSTTVYSKDRTIYAVSTLSDPIRQIWVYNAQGALVYANPNVNAASCTISREVNLPEVCVVKLITGQGVKNVKVLVK
jgi:hypothetical protein